METTRTNQDSNPANRDPLTKEPGSHPVGTGVGSAGGAAAGVAIGAVVGGPIGAVVGGAIGAVAGGAAGRAAGEAVNPTVEGAYWSENYKTRPYYREGQSYTDYQPAYRYGWESGTRPEYRGRKFGEVEGELEKGWEKVEGSTARTWAQARDAARDAWDRVHGD
jgi:phage tail tape-measure protein